MGAGTSKPAGVPLMDDFLALSWRYLHSRRVGAHPRETERFRNAYWYGVDAGNGDHHLERFFKQVARYRADDPVCGTAVWNDLNFVMVRTIDIAESEGRGEREGLNGTNPQELYDHFLGTILQTIGVQHVTLITPNYDLLIDQALLRLGYRPEYHLAHAVDVHARPDGPEVTVLKPHGSANWFICADPTCTKVSVHWDIGPGNIAPGGMPADPGHHPSAQPLDFLLVPPDHKAGQNLWDQHLLKSVWSQTRAALGMADTVYFVGYGFPETDWHIVEALRESWRTRVPSNLIVVNPGDVRSRYEAVFAEIFECRRPCITWWVGKQEHKFENFVYESLPGLIAE